MLIALAFVLCSNLSRNNNYPDCGEHVALNTTNLRPHTQDQTQYRRPTVKEHYHHWNSEQDFV
jgi:hypothetical protein